MGLFLAYLMRFMNNFSFFFRCGILLDKALREKNKKLLCHQNWKCCVGQSNLVYIRWDLPRVKLNQLEGCNFSQTAHTVAHQQKYWIFLCAPSALKWITRLSLRFPVCITKHYLKKTHIGTLNKHN